VVLELASDIVFDKVITFYDSEEQNILEIIMQVAQSKPYIIKNPTTRFTLRFDNDSLINLVAQFAGRAKRYEVVEHF